MAALHFATEALLGRAGRARGSKNLVAADRSPPVSGPGARQPNSRSRPPRPISRAGMSRARIFGENLAPSCRAVRSAVVLLEIRNSGGARNDSRRDLRQAGHIRANFTGTISRIVVRGSASDGGI